MSNKKRLAPDTATVSNQNPASEGVDNRSGILCSLLGTKVAPRADSQLAEQARNRDHHFSDPCGQTKKQQQIPQKQRHIPACEFLRFHFRTAVRLVARPASVHRQWRRKGFGSAGSSRGWLDRGKLAASLPPHRIRLRSQLSERDMARSMAWMRTMLFDYRWPTHGYAATREAAMPHGRHVACYRDDLPAFFGVR